MPKDNDYYRLLRFATDVVVLDSNAHTYDEVIRP